MKKENTIIIGHYHIPGCLYSVVYTEDSKTYKKEKFEVFPGEVNDTIIKLKAMYPKHCVCEFYY